MDYPFLHFREKIVTCKEMKPIRIVDKIREAYYKGKFIVGRGPVLD
jgi:hypothetical protein